MKNSFAFWLALGVVALLFACGGGGSISTGGGAQSVAPEVTVPTLSADQQLFEMLSLSDRRGAHRIDMHLPSGTSALNKSVHYFFQSVEKLNHSPGSGSPQIIKISGQSLTPTLGFPSSVPVSWYLQGGDIVTSLLTDKQIRYSYVGSGVRMDALAADASTLAFSIQLHDFALTPLTGLMADVGGELAHFLYPLFDNKNLTKPNAAWQSNASYLSYKMTMLNDSYRVSDCGGGVAANPRPCQSSANLESYFAERGLDFSAGEVTTVQGRRAWVSSKSTVASAAGTQYANDTPAYLVYVELGGSVYRASLVRAGTNLQYYYSIGHGAGMADRELRFNQEAIDSLKAGIAF